MSTQSFALNQIILIESNFRRDLIINFGNKDFVNNTDMKVTHAQNDKELSVTVNMVFSSNEGDRSVVNADVKMAGLFTIPDNNDLPLDTFINVNAPAMIFPFIREHLSSLSLKAAINPILLQPINFVKLSNDNKN